ncbi:MAG: glycosyltransferase family 39 protein [Candidatus Omnitrophota bacterium]|nr:glycosyltransferase family 39 protein [Candidatus Omnitrophota bacterium]
MKILERPIIVVLLLLVLSGYLYFFQLDKIALTDPDETFYGQTAKEMFLKGEWITPTLYGQPQFEKPILFYWLIEISYKIFGINEFAVRFPCALFGFLGLVGIYLLGRLLFNNRTGIFSAVILATSLEYLILSIGCVTDMVLFTLLLFGVLFFFYGEIRKKDYFYLLSSAAFALATLTKGPIGLLLPASIIVLYLALTKKLAIFKKGFMLAGVLIVFAVIAKPWYIIMYKIHAQDFVNVFFGFQNITRFLTPEHKTGSQIYYNIPIILGGFFPWSVFLPLGFWHICKKAFASKHNTQYTIRNTSDERNYSLFILLWFIFIFLFFTASSTKLPTYIFPCFLSLALMTGRLWDDFLNKKATQTLINKMKVSYCFLPLLILLIFIGVCIFVNMDYPEMLGKVIITGLFLIFGIALSLTAYLRKKFIAAFLLIAYSVALIVYPLDRLILPALEPHESSKALAKEILKYYKEGERIGSEYDYRAGIAFYTGKVPVKIADYSTSHELMGSKERVWCVLKQKNVADLNGPGVDNPKKVVVVFKSGKKRLITNKPL